MNEQEILKQKNSNWSILLIIINTILVLIYMNVGYFKDSVLLGENIFWLSVSMNVFLVFYAFGYHGKKYRLGKILFILLSICNIAFYTLLSISSKSFHP